MKIDFGVIVVYTPLLMFRYGKSKSHAEKHFFLLLTVIIALKWIMPQLLYRRS
jgi:hypothetical protein